MLLPFSPGPEQPENPPVPDVVPMEALTNDAIEKAEAEIEAEENEWLRTA